VEVTTLHAAVPTSMNIRGINHSEAKELWLARDWLLGNARLCAHIQKNLYISNASANYRHRYISVPPDVRLPAPIRHILWSIPLPNRLSIHG